MKDAYINLTQLPVHHTEVQQWLFNEGYQWGSGDRTPIYEGMLLAYIIMKRNDKCLSKLDLEDRSWWKSEIESGEFIDYTYYALAMLCNSKLGRLLV